LHRHYIRSYCSFSYKRDLAIYILTSSALLARPIVCIEQETATESEIGSIILALAHCLLVGSISRHVTADVISDEFILLLHAPMCEGQASDRQAERKCKCTGYLRSNIADVGMPAQQ
jgi:hypothetical protein